jgi:hypothetical protein
MASTGRMGKPGEKLHEERTYLTIDGKAVREGKKEVLPFELIGAFSAIPETFLTPAQVLCYSFTAMPAAADGSVQYSFVTKPDPPTDCKTAGVTLHGRLQADPATAEIRHVERTITSPIAQGQHQVTFIGVDYAPAAIGNQTLWLPKELKADLDGNLGHFSARYSGFRRFTATVTIRSGRDPVPEVP